MMRLLLLAGAVLAGFAFWRFGPWSAASPAEFRMAGGGDIPTAVAVGPDGSVWFTIDNSNAIGVLRDSIVQRIAKGRDNLEPLGLAVAPDGHVWFTDALADSIGQLSPDGSIELTPLPTGVTQFGRLSVAPDGGVWFADSWTNSVVRLKDGIFTPYVARTPNAGPFGVTVDANGVAWAALQNANKLVRIDTDGQVAEFEVPTRSAGPSDVAVDASGGVWFIELRAGKIGHFADNRFTEYPVRSPSAGLTSLAVARDGGVWFAELREHTLGRLRDGRLAELRLPRDDARPFGVAVDERGDVWYTDLTGWLGHVRADQAGTFGLDLRGMLWWPGG